MDDWAANDADLAALMGWTPEPLPFDDGFTQIWSLAAAHGALYAGAKPARLLKSVDGGATWREVTALREHPSAPEWNPSAAGLAPHTITPHPRDPQKMWLGGSAAGAFATEDGGASFERRNRLSNAEACEGHAHPAAPADGERGKCVHNIAFAAGAGERLYQQNHHGVWRSGDGARCARSPAGHARRRLLRRR